MAIITNSLSNISPVNDVYQQWPRIISLATFMHVKKDFIIKTML